MGPRPRTELDADGGFTLAEVLVAMVIFTVISGSVLGLLIKIASASGDNLRRTTASNLASEQIEMVRNANPDNLVLGYREILPKPKVGNVEYTVSVTTSLANNSSELAVCDSSSGTDVAYKVVIVQVKWDGIGRLKPVRADTLVGLDTYGTSVAAGNMAVTVSGFDGPVANAKVTLTPSTPLLSQNTGDDGCTAFAGLSFITYTATPDKIGYVGTNNSRAPQQTIAVPNQTLIRSAFTYARGRSVDVAFGVPVGFAQPSGVPLRIGGTYTTEHALPACTASSTSECTTGLPGRVNYVYPDTYTVKAGTCTEISPSSASAVAVALTGDPSTVPVATIPLGAISVTVKNMLGSPVPNKIVTFTPATPGLGCDPLEIYQATTGVSGSASLALPYGKWTVKTTSIPLPVPTPIPTLIPTPSPLNQDVTVSPSSRTSTAALIVTS